MSQPLPETLRRAKPDGDFNAGLWYDKFFDHWESGFNIAMKNGKSGWVSDRSHDACGNCKQLQEQEWRIHSLTKAAGGCIRYFKTEGPFVTGLGRAHPVGNGFTWHHILGVPYLSGSSVKGMLRAFVREHGVAHEDIRRIFGGSAAVQTGCGSVTFLDALPRACVRLRADIMTPHYDLYYQDENACKPPADWYYPVPIPFLTVDRNQSFYFVFLPHRIDCESDRTDCEQAARWLGDALCMLGAGAKTLVGYGRFVFDAEATRQAEENYARHEKKREKAHQKAQLRARLHNLSPLAQDIECQIAEQKLDTDRNAFMAPPLPEVWLDRLEKEPAPDALGRLEQLVRVHLPGLLDNPDKTRGKKNTPVFNNRQKTIARRLMTLKAAVCAGSTRSEKPPDT